jgi:hypothetical protein
MMNKTCRQCSSGFEIGLRDQELYKMVSPRIKGEVFELPLPRDCPDCRQQRRVAYRNESVLYKRKCDFSGESIVSTYHHDCEFPVYSQEVFWGDKWDALKYGQEVDFGRSFTEQFGELSRKVPRLGIVNKQSQNSDYCNFSFANKNCYLTFGSHYEEDCMYGRYSTKNKDCMDYFWCYGSTLCYECMFCSNCYGCVQLERSEQCSDCYFSYDLKGCKNCLFSSNLRNKQYYIFNKEHTKEEYEDYFEKLKISSEGQWGKLREGWLKFRTENAIFRDVYQVNCVDCEGNDHQNSKNLKHCFASSDCEDCAYGVQMDNCFNCIDNSHLGYDKCDLLYNCVGNNGNYKSICCDSCWHSSELLYCNLCFSSKNCFGCIGLHQKQYCIFNKQYSQEEYEEIVPRLIEGMIETGEWGEFFSKELYPYSYNESVAQEFFPLEKSQALSLGYGWREDVDDVGGGNDDKVLICEETGRPFKVVKEELEFYEKLGLPLPVYCPAQRTLNRLKLKSQNKLCDRDCSKCGVGVKSTFEAGGVEKVYCEKCYLEAVY